jgi:rRNA-processing protein FCF1
MKHVVLDTNFILTCIRQKIDFFEELQLLGLSIAIPKEVLQELKDISRSKDEAKIALSLLEKSSYKKVNIGSRNVDEGIIRYANLNKEIAVATLDREMKNRIKNPKITIRNKKKLEIV